MSDLDLQGMTDVQIKIRAILDVDRLV
jgi:hypothetical protein